MCKLHLHEILQSARSDGVTAYWVCLSLRPVLTACFDCPRLDIKHMYNKNIFRYVVFKIICYVIILNTT